MECPIYVKTVSPRFYIPIHPVTGSLLVINALRQPYSVLHLDENNNLRCGARVWRSPPLEPRRPPGFE